MLDALVVAALMAFMVTIIYIFCKLHDDEWWEEGMRLSRKLDRRRKNK